MNISAMRIPLSAYKLAAPKVASDIAQHIGIMSPCQMSPVLKKFSSIAKHTIGFVGLGNMGSRMARRMLQKNAVVGYDINQRLLDTAVSSGVTAASSAAAVASTSDVLLTMVNTDSDVLKVYLDETDGVLSKARPGSVLINCTSCKPETSVAVAAAAAERGCSFLDAPVSGRSAQAEQGTLTLMVGASSREAFFNVEALLNHLGSKVVLCGGVGTGQVARICNTLVLGISMAAVCEGHILGERMGLCQKALAEIMNSSTGRCWSSEKYNPCPGVMEGVPASRGYVGNLPCDEMAKQLGIAMATATSSKQSLPVTSLVHKLYVGMSSSHKGAKDFSGLYEILYSAKHEKSREGKADFYDACDVPSGPELAEACAVQSAEITQGGAQVRVAFSDGSAYDFHGMWLRDACQDSALYHEKVGERYLNRIPFATQCEGVVTSAKIIDGSLTLTFDDTQQELVGRPLSFPSDFLRNYGPIVGRPVDSAYDCQPPMQKAFKWLQCYADADNAPPVDSSLKSLWKNKEGLQIQYRDYGVVRSSSSDNLELLQTLARHGVVILNGAPHIANPSIVRDLADDCLGGIMKNPARDEPTWIIRKKENAASPAYDYTTRLNNHTDQAPAPYGVPALVVVMYYACGHGVNTIVDSHAVAKALRERDPDAFRMLCTYGVCHQRDFIQSRVDFRDSHQRVAPEKLKQSLLVNSKRPILQCDSEGAIIRVEYNEMSRMPSTVPFRQFPDWYNAYLLWNEMIHSNEFEVEVNLKAGQFLLLDNWRVLHGRKGQCCSPDRLLMGGNVSREAFVSKALKLMDSGHYPVADVLV